MNLPTSNIPGLGPVTTPTAPVTPTSVGAPIDPRYPSTSTPPPSGSFAQISLLDPRFGVVGDGVTDDWQAFMNLQQAFGSEDFPAGTTIRVPAFNPDGSPRTYRFSKPLHIIRCFDLVGEGGTPGYYGPTFLFDAGQHGLIYPSAYQPALFGGYADGAKASNLAISCAGGGSTRTITDAELTAGSTTLTSTSANFTDADVGRALIEPGNGSNGTAFTCLTAGTSILEVINGTTVTLDTPASATGTSTIVIGGATAINIGAHVTLQDLRITGTWPGHGVQVRAHTPYANANGFILNNVYVDECDLDGFNISGGDANAGIIYGCASQLAGGADFRDDSGLGNTYIACESNSGGTNDDGPAFMIGASNNGGTVNSSQLFGSYVEGSRTSYMGEYVFATGLVADGPGVTLSNIEGVATFSGYGYLGISSPTSYYGGIKFTYAAGGGQIGNYLEAPYGGGIEGLFLVNNSGDLLGVDDSGNIWSTGPIVGFARPIQTVAAAYQVEYTDGTILANATTAAFAVTLPPVADVAPGSIFTIKKTDNAAHNVTVTPSGASTIDGAATYPLTAQYQKVTVQTDGTNWYEIA